MTFKSAEHKKGREDFEERFTNQLQKNQGLSINIEWYPKHFDNQKLAVIVNDKRIVLVIENSELNDFGAGGPELFRIDLLNRKEKELIEQLQQS